ncbi:MAG: carboxypeptidase regulatory-like domain-containing protein [Planctomycetes bacterium]|nr:carboxypeptidase regulatory-like domain-containing protein [Planctomycetota bacterium]
MSHRTGGRASLWPALGLLCAVGGALGVALVLAFGVREQAPSAERGATLAPEHASAASPVPGVAEAHGAPTAVARLESSNESDVIVRVVDAAGAPLAGLPIGLVDRVRHPRPLLEALDPSARRFDLLTRGGGSISRPEQDLGFLNAGQMFPGLPNKDTRPGTYQDWIAHQTSLRSSWPLDGEPETLEIHLQLLATATTDAQGQASLPWDRGAQALVQVIFAFPSLAIDVGMLDASKASVPARIEMRAPELVRLQVRATQDLDPSSGARWRARVAMRPAEGNAERRWIAWEAPRPLDEGAMVELVWERGLDARLEAAVDAPLASLLLFPLANDAEPSSLALRASEHYSLLRGTVHDALGEPVGRIPIELRRGAPRARSPFVSFDRAELVLDEQSRFTAWAPSAPRRIEAREHAIYLLDEPEIDAQGNVRPAWREKLSKIELRDYPLEDRETYFELGTPDPAGFVRELGVLRLGYGPCIVAGRVLWETGEAVDRPELKLATRATSRQTGDFEVLRVDEQGRFRRLGIPGRETLELLVRAPGMTSTARFPVEAGRRDVELRLPHRGALAGRVILDAWAPIEIVVRAANGEELEAKTSANGAFEVPGVPFGTCAVELRSGGVALQRVEGIELAQRGMAHPEALREIDLRPHTTIVRLELRNAQRRALKNRRFELVASTSRFHLRGSSLDDGSCALVLPRGIERAELRVEGFRAQELPLDQARIAVELIAAR